MRTLIIGLILISIHELTPTAAVISVGLDGAAPTFPVAKPHLSPGREDVDLWPDYVPPDEQ